MTENLLVGGIEFGGTKTVVAVGSNDGTIIERISLPTVEPHILVPQIAAFFRDNRDGLGTIEALGVGAFGPIIIDKKAPDYGTVLQTNKPGWSGFDLASALRLTCGVAPDIVTDVAAAGIAEAALGALQGIDIGVYLTVGTGIGGAIICDGKPLPALLHPEMGHITLQRHCDDHAPSTCRFHANCAEGLAAGPAIMTRFEKSLSDFSPNSIEHGLIADYLAQLCANLVLTLSPQRIVMGGGVASTPGLIATVQVAMQAHLGDYGPKLFESERFLSAPKLGEDSGVVGALCLTSKMGTLVY
jgi:fructokinase